jgi:8-oxo-dGTP pyrophosphatase MutT (NUDIX family)
MKEPTARSHKRKTPAARRVKVEISAGGVVFKRTPQGVLVAMILDPFTKWAFAKGHVEAGETVEEAALRETQEEMGLESLRVVAPLGRIDFWFRDRYRPETSGMLVHKYVHYFLLEAPPDAKGRPQVKEKIRRVVWVSLKQATARSSYKDVLPMLERVRSYFSGAEDRKRPPARSDVRRRPWPGAGPSRA